MSGVLEAILGELQAIRAALASGAAATPAAAAQPAATPAAQPAAIDPFAPAAQPAAAPAQVTEAMVMGLIEPHLSNTEVKTALSGVLAQLGIARLPDARPDQYAEMYQRFQQVIAQHAGNTATASVGII